MTNDFVLSVFKAFCGMFSGVFVAMLVASTDDYKHVMYHEGPEYVSPMVSFVTAIFLGVVITTLPSLMKYVKHYLAFAFVGYFLYLTAEVGYYSSNGIKVIMGFLIVITIYLILHPEMIVADKAQTKYLVD